MLESTGSLSEQWRVPGGDSNGRPQLIRALVILLVGGVSIAALVTPPIYELLSRTVGIPWEFSRIFQRVLLATVLVLLFVLRHPLRVERVRDAFVRNDWRQTTLDALFGLTISLGLALGAVPLFVATTDLQWTHERTPAWLVLKTIRAIPGVMLVALVEEILFRVIVFRGLQQSMRVSSAAIVGSLLYATVHFWTPGESYPSPGLDPIAALDTLHALMLRLLQPSILLAQVGLVLIGVTLCFCLHRSGSIFLCIGLHGGWLAATKFAIHASNADRLPPGTDKRLMLVGNPWIWLSVALVGFVVAWRYRRRDIGLGDSAAGA